jgi:hypothetical protein
MKHIAATLATVLAVGLSGIAEAKPFDHDSSNQTHPQLTSLLVSDQATAVEEVTDRMPPAPGRAEKLVDAPPVPMPDATNTAPLMDATQPMPTIAPPIVDPTVTEQPAATVQRSSQVQHHYHRPRAEKKQNVFEKLMEMERKKNAWLKRRFFGK